MVLIAFKGSFWFVEKLVATLFFYFIWKIYRRYFGSLFSVFARWNRSQYFPYSWHSNNFFSNLIGENFLVFQQIVSFIPNLTSFYTVPCLGYSESTSNPSVRYPLHAGGYGICYQIILKFRVITGLSPMQIRITYAGPGTHVLATLQIQ